MIMVNQNILILRPKFNIFWAIFIRLFLTFNTSAFYYIGHDTPPEATQQSYLDALPLMGYSLITKPIKTQYDAKTVLYSK
jgi:hypothetical protein